MNQELQELIASSLAAGRRSGRSTRMLQQAVAAAQSEPVTVIVGSAAHIDVFRGLMSRLAQQPVYQVKFSSVGVNPERFFNSCVLSRGHFVSSLFNTEELFLDHWVIEQWIDYLRDRELLPLIAASNWDRAYSILGRLLDLQRKLDQINVAANS